MPEIIAAIDIGTNTARLLIASVIDSTIHQISIMRRITRLGGGFSRQNGISFDAQERTISALREFAEELNRYSIARCRAVATSAVRDAVNGPEFCTRVRKETGIALEIIDGREEGIMTLNGVLSGLSSIPERLLLFDVGGGSTEYTIAAGVQPLFSASCPLGVVRLTEGKENLAAMSNKIDRELDILRHQMAQSGYLGEVSGSCLVGTAGTATTLAAISMGMTDYDYRKVNNYKISLNEIESIFSCLLPLPPEKRLETPGLEPGREDLIIAGILITLKTMAAFQCDTLTVSDFGLLEGVILST